MTTDNDKKAAGDFYEKEYRECFEMCWSPSDTKLLKDYITNIETPMEGKRMGERLQWLNSQIGKITEIFKRLKNLIHECITR